MTHLEMGGVILSVGVAILIWRDLDRTIRTKKLRDIIDKLTKLTNGGPASMMWKMAPKVDPAPERSVPYDLIYTWEHAEVKIVLTLEQRNKARATIVLHLGGQAMPTWHYGPGASKKLSDLLPDLHQILGDNDIKVVSDPAAA